MNAVAAIAIVAMFLAFLWAGIPQGPSNQSSPSGDPEVILYIDPPASSDIFFPSLPDRNPTRG
jgi:hypothetical protein